MRTLLTVGLVCAMFGCSSKEEPLRPRGIAPEDNVPRGSIVPPVRAPEPPPPPPPSSLGSPFANLDPGALMKPQEAPSAPVQAAAANAQAPADAGVAARDLSAELAALLGRPTDCVDLAAIAANGGKLNLSVTAQVVPSGRITRASVSAPGQAATAVKCLEQKAAALSMRGPVPGAPLPVTAVIPIEVVAQSPQP